MKIRKIIAGTLCVACLFGSCFASAENPRIVSDVSDYSITVSGTLNTDRAKTDLLLRMKNGSGNDILMEFGSSFFKNGEVVYEFDKILLPESLSSGSYTVEISGKELASPLSVPYEYIGPDRILQILRTIRDASNIGSAISANATELSLDASDYSLLNAEGLALFETLMSRVTYNLPETHEGEVNRTQIRNETVKLFSAYENAICVSLFESIEDAADVAAWVGKYYTALGFNLEDTSTAYSEAAISGYFETVKTGEAFKDKLVAARNLDTTDKIKAYVYESALLSVIKEKRGSIVMEMMPKFPQFFAISPALDDLNPTVAAQCFTNIAGTLYASYQAATDALNAEIGKNGGSPGGSSIIIDPGNSGNSGGNGGSGGGGGGGSFGGGSFGGGNVVIGDVSGNETNSGAGTSNKTAFRDMDSTHWAYDAVQLLCERGIVSGHGDNTFAPDAYVTRAEFIKMITVAMSLKSTGNETPFADVSRNDWFAPYAAMAYKEGIVLGDTEGRFNPHQNISRQDMVTVLYRAMKIAEAPASAGFSDSNEISDYAKTAVSYFAGKGIVNGMGDGRFAPLANATRAQAAKILYSIITAKN